VQYDDGEPARIASRNQLFELSLTLTSSLKHQPENDVIKVSWQVFDCGVLLDPPHQEFHGKVVKLNELFVCFGFFYLKVLKISSLTHPLNIYLSVSVAVPLSLLYRVPMRSSKPLNRMALQDMSY
jgi:hypothetical protein